ncbi:MAG: calcium-binding protein, partial [Candidatus Binatia bacterium]
AVNGNYAKSILDRLISEGYSDAVWGELNRLVREIAPPDNSEPPSYGIDGTEYGIRQSGVTNYYVQGEIVNTIRFPFTTVLGSDNLISIGGADQVSAITLHAVNLHAALLLDDKLRANTTIFPNLLSLMLDERLYARRLEGRVPDFLTSLLNDQIRLGYDAPNGLLKQFSLDVEKLAQGGTVSSDHLGKALIAAAIEDYYFMQSGFTKEFFQNIAGGIKFDLNDIALDGGASRAKPRLFAATENLLGPDGIERYRGGLDGSRVWYVQAGEGALNVTGGTENDALLGGAGGDVLNGAVGNDFIFGGDGADTLEGGQGFDTLVGGSGFDTYRFRSGAGHDSVVDRDGTGEIIFDGTPLSGGAKVDHDINLWKCSDGQFFYSLVDQGDGVQ